MLILAVIFSGKAFFTKVIGCYAPTEFAQQQVFLSYSTVQYINIDSIYIVNNKMQYQFY